VKEQKTLLKLGTYIENGKSVMPYVPTAPEIRNYPPYDSDSDKGSENI
jgi:hypothetical protein